MKKIGGTHRQNWIISEGYHTVSIFNFNTKLKSTSTSTSVGPDLSTTPTTQNNRSTMASLNHSCNRPSRNSCNMRFLLTLSLLAITTFHPRSFHQVTAQHAGKFASRSKLVDLISRKKKSKKVANEEGEYRLLWTRYFKRKEGETYHEGVGSSWRRDLYSAEFHLMLLSIMSSGLFAVLSWVWFRAMNKSESVLRQELQGEKGGECMFVDTCLPLFR